MERLLKSVEGVISADASFIRGQAVVKYDPQRTNAEAFIEKLNRESPYRASLMMEKPERTALGAKRLLLRIKGPRALNPTERALAWALVGEALGEFPGVLDLKALDDGGAELSYDPESVSEEEVLGRADEAIYRALGKGFEVKLSKASEGEKPPGIFPVALPLAVTAAAAGVIALFLKRRSRRSVSEKRG